MPGTADLSKCTPSNIWGCEIVQYMSMYIDYTLTICESIPGMKYCFDMHAPLYIHTVYA